MCSDIGGVEPSGPANAVLADPSFSNATWIEMHTSCVVSANHMKRALTAVNTKTCNTAEFRFVCLRFTS
jgi:hypothetical protein